MTKQQAIEASVELLVKMYTKDEDWNAQHIAVIRQASAEGNVKTLCDALNGLIEFCYDLKNDLYQDERQSTTDNKKHTYTFRGC